MDTFYVIVPSNSPEGPNAAVAGNTISNFTVRLPNTIDLSEGDWSVALSSIIYPVSFQADSKEEMSVGIVYADKPTKFIPLPSDLSFSSIEHLEKTVNETILGHVIQTRTARAVEEAEEDEDDEEVERTKRDEDILSEKDQKLLNAAANEVQTRSYGRAQELATELEDTITDIEMLGAKVERLQIGMEIQIVISENFSKEEAQDIDQKITKARRDAINIRNNAQRKRVDVSAVLSEYGVLIEDFETALQAKDVPEARKLANRAKTIVKRLEEIKGGIDEDKRAVKILVDFLFETSAELSQMLKPIDIGMKNTISRIKEAILKKAGPIDLEVYFYFDENFGRFFLYNHKPMEIKAVALSPRLAYMMGFEIDKVSREVKHVRMRREGGFAKFTPDIKAGIHQLYVYAPGLVDSTYVGNVQAPLLRIVNVDKPPNSIAESIYSNMHYIKVIEKRISSIKIQIHDSFGEFIRFNWGNIIITLAFKRNLF